jgi:hypothetical protein
LTGKTFTGEELKEMLPGTCTIRNNVAFDIHPSQNTTLKIKNISGVVAS